MRTSNKFYCGYLPMHGKTTVFIRGDENENDVDGIVNIPGNLSTDLFKLEALSLISVIYAEKCASDGVHSIKKEGGDNADLIASICYKDNNGSYWCEYVGFDNIDNRKNAIKENDNIDDSFIRTRMIGVFTGFENTILFSECKFEENKPVNNIAKSIKEFLYLNENYKCELV